VENLVFQTSSAEIEIVPETKTMGSRELFNSHGSKKQKRIENSLISKERIFSSEILSLVELTNNQLYNGYKSLKRFAEIVKSMISSEFDCSRRNLKTIEQRHQEQTAEEMDGINRIYDSFFECFKSRFLFICTVLEGIQHDLAKSRLEPFLESYKAERDRLFKLTNSELKSLKLKLEELEKLKFKYLSGIQKCEQTQSSTDFMNGSCRNYRICIEEYNQMRFKFETKTLVRIQDDAELLERSRIEIIQEVLSAVVTKVFPLLDVLKLKWKQLNDLIYSFDPSNELQAFVKMVLERFGSFRKFENFALNLVSLPSLEPLSVSFQRQKIFFPEFKDGPYIPCFLLEKIRAQSGFSSSLLFRAEKLIDFVKLSDFLKNCERFHLSDCDESIEFLGELFKVWLQQIPDILFGTEWLLFGKTISSKSSNNSSVNETITMAKHMLGETSKKRAKHQNYVVGLIIELFKSCLAQKEKNYLDISELACIFGPILIRKDIELDSLDENDYIENRRIWAFAAMRAIILAEVPGDHFGQIDEETVYSEAIPYHYQNLEKQMILAQKSVSSITKVLLDCEKLELEFGRNLLKQSQEIISKINVEDGMERTFEAVQSSMCLCKRKAILRAELADFSLSKFAQPLDSTIENYVFVSKGALDVIKSFVIQLDQMKDKIEKSKSKFIQLSTKVSQAQEQKSQNFAPRLFEKISSLLDSDSIESDKKKQLLIKNQYSELVDRYHQLKLTFESDVLPMQTLVLQRAEMERLENIKSLFSGYLEHIYTYLNEESKLFNPLIQAYQNLNIQADISRFASSVILRNGYINCFLSEFQLDTITPPESAICKMSLSEMIEYQAKLFRIESSVPWFLKILLDGIKESDILRFEWDCFKIFKVDFFQLDNLERQLYTKSSQMIRISDGYLCCAFIITWLARRPPLLSFNEEDSAVIPEKILDELLPPARAVIVEFLDFTKYCVDAYGFGLREISLIFGPLFVKLCPASPGVLISLIKAHIPASAQTGKNVQVGRVHSQAVSSRPVFDSSMPNSPSSSLKKLPASDRPLPSYK
jgi:hypothetical protein